MAGKHGGARKGSGAKKRIRPKSSVAQQVLDEIGEKKAWTEQWEASAGDLRVRRDLFNDLLNRVYGKAPQAVIPIDPDGDPTDLAARRERVRDLIARLAGGSK